MSKAHITLCTCPDEATAAELATGLVGEKLVACVNILPGIRSIYRWQGTVSDDAEVMMVIKSMAFRSADIESWLLEHHPYDVPEVISLETAQVSKDYLAWIEASVGN